MDFRKVGRVRVDSGRLLFIDPCYVQSDASAASTRKTVADQLPSGGGGQLKYSRGHSGLGVVAAHAPIGMHDVWIGEEAGTIWRLEVWFGDRRDDGLAHRVLGLCGVDAGQIMVVDPENLDPHWVEPEAATVVGVTFWGGDEELLLKAFGNRVEDYSGGVGPHLIRGDDGQAIEAEVRAVAASIGARKFVTHIERRSTYEAVCAITRQGAGSLPFPRSRDGWLVATTSGDGDGTYEVAELVDPHRSNVCVALMVDFRAAEDK